MKRHITYLLLAFICVVSSNAQVIVKENEMRSVTNPDTILVNDNTSYLLFNHDIIAYAIGNETDFTGLAFKNALHLRAKTRMNGSISSVFVSYGDSTYLQHKYCILKYEPYQMSEFYDFRDDYYKYKISNVQKREERAKLEEEEKDYFIAEVKTRAKNIMNLPDEMDMGNTINNLSLLIRLIRIDAEYAYIKYEFINKSAIDYEFEKVSFQYEEKFKQGFLKKKKIRNIDVFPLIQPDYLRVNAYETKSIVYVIPIYGLDEKECLVTTFREKLGARNIEIRCDSEIISGSKLLFKN